MGTILCTLLVAKQTSRDSRDVGHVSDNRETERYPYESRKPCDSTAGGSTDAIESSGLITPACLCLLFCILTMGSGRLFWWAFDNRPLWILGRPSPTAPPHPLPLWMLDSIWIASLFASGLFAILSV